ncbi:MAG: LacI family DNA-binding transcriptional regulator, partial [Phycisphaerae bacterium]
MSDRKVSLRSIAERVHVSAASVSYVLNGKGRMSDDKRQAIQRALREAGYRPRHKRFPVFYLLNEQGFRDMHAFEPFFRGFHSLSTVLRTEHVTLRPFFLRLEGGTVASNDLKDLLAMRVGGVFLDASLQEAMGNICQTLCREEVPAVQLGHVALSPIVDAVVVDSFGGAYDATRYLVSKGHQRIATIRWNVTGDPASIRKFAGYTCAF